MSENFLQHAARRLFDTNSKYTGGYTAGSSIQPDRPLLVRGGERSIVNSIYNRIAIDAAQYNIRHVKLDDAGRFLEYEKARLMSV